MAAPGPPDALRQAEQALHAGNVQQARALLVEFIRTNPSSERAWWLLSFAVPEESQQTDCLKRVLQINPANLQARDRLAKLKRTGSLPPIQPEVNPFVGGSEPAADSSKPPGPEIGRPPAPTPSPATGPQAPARAEGPPAASPPPPAWSTSPGAPTVPPGEKPGQVPPKKKRGNWWIADLLMAATVLCVVGFMAWYYWSQQQGDPEAQAMQQTLEMARALTENPLPTQPATWTPTATGTPSLTPTPTETVTITPDLIGPMLTMLAPDFDLVEALTGRQVSLSQYAGQPVLLFFWNMACTTCRIDMNDLEVVYQTYQPEGLVLLAVNRGDGQAEAAAFARANGLTFPILLDGDGAVHALYEVEEHPQYFFIHANGRIGFIDRERMDRGEVAWQVRALLQNYSTATPTP